MHDPLAHHRGTPMRHYYSRRRQRRALRRPRHSHRAYFALNLVIEPRAFRAFLANILATTPPALATDPPTLWGLAIRQVPRA